MNRFHPLDNNPVENVFQPIAIGKKNALTTNDPTSDALHRRCMRHAECHGKSEPAVRSWRPAREALQARRWLGKQQRRVAAEAPECRVAAVRYSPVGVCWGVVRHVQPVGQRGVLIEQTHRVRAGLRPPASNSRISGVR